MSVLQGEILAAGEWTPEEAASHVCEAWQNAVESIVETGRRLVLAKEKVGHGNWLPTVQLLPFSEATAQRLMQIARHPDLSNPAHGRDLPATWRTLAVLAQLPPGEVTKRIEAGEITPELDRATAQTWVSTYDSQRQRDIEAGRRYAASIVTDFNGAVVTIISAVRLGESGLITAAMIRELREALDLLEGEL